MRNGMKKVKWYMVNLNWMRLDEIEADRLGPPLDKLEAARAAGCAWIMVDLYEAIYKQFRKGIIHLSSVSAEFPYAWWDKGEGRRRAGE